MRRPALARVGLRRLGATSGGGGGGVTAVNVSAPITKTGPATSPTIGISAATTLAAGSMSAADKAKLDGITPGASITSVGVTAPISNTGTATAPVIAIAAATTSTAGSLSAADKTKLDSITSGAAVASVGVTAPISNTGTATAPVIAISAATTGAAGSMSAADKTKLDGIGAGATLVSLGITAPLVNTGTATAPVVAINNSGTTAGRAGLPLLIQRTTLTASTSVPISFSAGAYREIEIYVRVTGGTVAGSSAFMRFNNDSGAASYIQAGFAIQGTSFVQFPTAGTANSMVIGVSGSASVVTSQDAYIRFCPLAVTGVDRGVFVDNFIKELAGSTILPFENWATWTDTTTAITDCSLTMGAAATGIVEVYATPA